MTSPTDALVRTSTSGGVTTLTLDSPHNRNALSSALIDQLLAGLAEAVADPRVRAVVLSHTGPVFCSGADLKETAAAFATGAVPAARIGELLDAVWHCPKPVVARVGGPVRAGGIGLVAAADIAVCVRDASFAFSEVRIGVIPAVISATVLPRLSSRAANELYLTGETFDGLRAERIGLVTAAVPATELDAEVVRYTDALVKGAPGALAGAKSLLRRAPARTFEEEVEALTATSVGYFLSDEGREGITAFREKRPARWVPTD
jgi:methylglutaconyl-CoA hydratase